MGSTYYAKCLTFCGNILLLLFLLATSIDAVLIVCIIAHYGSHPDYTTSVRCDTQMEMTPNVQQQSCNNSVEIKKTNH